MFTHSSSFKHKVMLFAALVLIVASMPSASWATPLDQDGDLHSRLQRHSEGALLVDVYQVTNVARFIQAEGGVITREFADLGLAPEAQARAFLSAYGGLFGLVDQEAQLELQTVKTDDLGMQHVRFAQRQESLPVFGADIIVHLGADGAVRVANGYIVPDAPALATQPSLAAEEAAAIAVAELGVDDAFVAESGLTVFNAGLITGRKSETRLAYRLWVDSASQPHLAQWVFVDAQTGAVRLSYPAVADARNRNTYNMRRSYSYSSAVLVRTEGDPPVTSADDCTVDDINNAHDYAGDTYDFYWSRFGRDSYNGQGADLNSYVCYGRSYNPPNAFWGPNTGAATYSEGMAADDVVAHEWTHGVTHFESGLIYAYQSGALNESYSDIFGEAIDLTNGSGNDSSGVRWSLGEDTILGTTRDMMNPPRFGDPDRTDSIHYYCGTFDAGGVHSNSGVPNKAFALMVDGGAFGGYTIPVIGLDRAVQIHYRSNSYYLTSAAQFQDNYNALNASCADLYGAFPSTCINARKALQAVRMNGPIPCGSGGSGFFSDSEQRLGSGRSMDVALGDLDGDNDLDAYVANYGADEVWRNDGAGYFTRIRQHFGSNTSSEAVALGDLDGDGDLDAFVANSGQANRVWWNNGKGGFFPSFQSLGNAQSMDVALGHLNNDDYLDAFVANDGANKVWLNDGQGGFNPQPGLGSADSLGVALKDLDGDYDLDAFVANYAANQVWLNDGSGAFSNSGQSLGNSLSFAVALGDLDGEGDSDAFIANVDADTVWLNDGHGNFSDTGQRLSTAYSFDVALGDVDGDGDLDAFVTTSGWFSGGPNTVWLNNGQSSFSDSGQRLGSAYSNGVALGDLDGDGDLDAFVANGGWPNGSANEVWFNLDENKW